MGKIRQISMEGLVWTAAELKPIAFGVNKLTIMCTIVDDLVSSDNLQEQIEAFEDDVQLTQNSQNLAFPSLPSVHGHLASSNQHHLQSWGRQHLLFICHHLERCQVSHLATSASPPPAGRTPGCQRVSPRR